MNLTIPSASFPVKCVLGVLRGAGEAAGNRVESSLAAVLVPYHPMMLGPGEVRCGNSGT